MLNVGYWIFILNAKVVESRCNGKRRVMVVKSKEEIWIARLRMARKRVSSLWLATSKGLIEDEG